MFKNAAHLFGKFIFWNAVVVIQTGLRTPADMQGGMDMGFGPFHDLTQFIPVVHIFKVHQFDGGAGDNEAVILFVANFIKGAVKGEQVVFRCVGGFVGFGLDEVDFNLQGGVGKAARKSAFRSQF